MRISLIAAMMLVSSAAVATATGWQASANAQQQPTIQVARAQHSGDNDPLTTPATSVLPPRSGTLSAARPTVPRPTVPRPTVPRPTVPRPGGYRGGDPSYTSQGNCQDLAYREQDIRGRLDNAPPSGQQHDRLVYQLGQVRSQLQRCR